jgi:mono/diheme cytochrome c family protein
MKKRVAIGVGALAVSATVAVAVMGGGDDKTSKALDSGDPVSFGQVQQVFTKNCVGCHPSVNGAIDLRPGKSYASIVGVGAIEAPGRVRVIAGDPEASFLYEKIAGNPALGDVPSVGTRMPPMAPVLPREELEIVGRWIAQGAKNDAGETVSSTAVPVAGASATFTGAARATIESGDGAIAGRVLDEKRRPLPGAIVTLLLKGETLPDGEEHVRAAITNKQGRYRLGNAPIGRIELKAYAPNAIYVSRVIEVASGATTQADFGLPNRKIPNPKISRPRVGKTAKGVLLGLRVDGFSLDRNYTVVVNPKAGRVFELRALKNAAGETRAGVWKRGLKGKFKGPWIFLAVDETCNVSEFLVVK